MRKALFLDRDGILNHVVYRNGKLSSPRCPEEVRYMDLDAAQLLALKAGGYLLVMITNQPDLERGLVSPEFVESFHAELRRRYHLDAVYVSPFSDPAHPWKKPNPGMFLAAAEAYGLNLFECFHLGDTDTDVAAARRCGCRSLLWNREYNLEVQADYRVRDLDEVRAILINGANRKKNSAAR